MLNAEEAQARLDAVANALWREDAMRRVSKVHHDSRVAARALLGAYTDSPFMPAEGRESLTAVGPLIEAMSDRKRDRLMSALHPGLGPTLSRWWVDARTQPYLTGYMRRGFRAPSSPQLTLDSRLHTLAAILLGAGPYEGDAAWLAAWAPFLHVAHEAGPVLASAIDAGDRAVFDTLVAAGSGTHPVAPMGRHVVAGLLRASRPDGWEFVERLLLAAQRQEGLRQTILEAADEAHPAAFDRLLTLVVEHDLLRFASTVRAAAVWLGLPLEVERIPELRTHLDLLRRLRGDARAREAAVESAEPWPAYLALVAAASSDVEVALRSAERLARHPSRDARAAAARFAAEAGLSTGNAMIVPLLDDPDLNVAALAHQLLARWSAPLGELERLVARLPEKPRDGEVVGVETEPVALSRAAVIRSIVRTEAARPDELLRWLPAMDAETRWQFVSRVAGARHLSPAVRRAMLGLLGDRSSNVRDEAARALAASPITPDEAPEVEALLSRRAGDLRRAAITLLARQPEHAALASAERLWSGTAAHRDAACELLGAMPGRSDGAVALARRFVAEDPARHESLADLVGVAAADPWAGVYDPARRAPVPVPRADIRKRPLVTDAARRAVSMVDDLVHAHRDARVVVMSWQGSSEMLLGDVSHELSWPTGPPNAVTETADGLLLGDVAREAWADRPADCRDAGALDALRAYVAVSLSRESDTGPYAYRDPDWWARILDVLAPERSVGALRYHPITLNVLAWLAVEQATPEVLDECLDAVEVAFAALPVASLLANDAQAQSWSRDAWRHTVTNAPWLDVLEGVLLRRPEVVDAERTARWFRLMRWLDEPRPGAPRRHVSQALLIHAYECGAATDDDVADVMLAPGTTVLAGYTRRHRAPLESRHPRVVAIADRVRDRVVEIERARGDLPTPATAAAAALSSVSGVELAVDLLAGLGRSALVRGWTHRVEGREAVFSHLLRVGYPGELDTPADLVAAARARKVPDARLVDLAVYAPQWAPMVEEALGWPGFEDAVWWFHAHTKDDQWHVPDEVRDVWAARSAERTPLDAGDLMNGAVDVEWFANAFAALGEERWDAVHRAAKLASSGGGHSRARLFADAMLGRVDEETLLARIRDKRHQDSVRALGLVPLPKDANARDAAALERFAVLREYERQAAQFGSQRQASERLAVRVGIDNLARTAGYPDPQRFVWAMEAAEAGDLADGPVTVRAGDVTVTLSVSAEGVPELAVVRGGKTLAAVPPALRKDAAVAALRERKTALTRQATRVRRSLEEAMVRQDPLTRADLDALDRHPVVAPMLRLLVFVDAGGRTLRRTSDGFRDVAGRTKAPSGDVRIAHPVDLLASGDWVRWQEVLFAEERRQPFKQAFRELYVPTRDETEGAASERYAGHQLQPRQAMALLGGRGWLNDYESGEVSRPFHGHGLVARLSFVNGYLTPLEVELPTVADVTFTRRGEWAAQPIASVPPVVFSEAMRDVDLVVSVAHAGGVDPEATASTVEMRAALVRETARLMRLGNVSVDGSHVVVAGSLGEYSVHLGSGVVHRRPGGAICIIPVDAQRRGRLFLPFADEDPRTAEVVAKVLLLAKDTQIKDPTILEQLRS